MNDICAGNLFQSTRLLDQSFFENTVLLITEKNNSGAMGFVLNKRFPRTLNELETFKDCPAFPLYDGGPVDKTHLYFIHKRADLIKDGSLIVNDIFYGGNFNEAVKHIQHNRLSTGDIKIFVGYCGWDKDELEAETAEGSWTALAEKTTNIFSM